MQTIVLCGVAVVKARVTA